MSAWQPIETAPKDGTRIILTDGRSVEAGCWAPNVHGDDFPWVFVDDYDGVDTTGGYVGVAANAYRADGVTHWMPLPPPPSPDQIQETEHGLGGGVSRATPDTLMGEDGRG